MTFTSIMIKYNNKNAESLPFDRDQWMFVEKEDTVPILGVLRLASKMNNT